METFRITGPGIYRRRDGETVDVYLRNPGHTYCWAYGYDGLGRSCVTICDEGLMYPGSNNYGDIVSRCPDATPAPAHETEGEAVAFPPMSNGGNIVPAQPSRLYRAKAAYDDARRCCARSRAVFEDDQARVAKAAGELDAAEREAAASTTAQPPAVLPERLASVARTVIACDKGMRWTRDDVISVLANTQNISSATLRAAVEGK